MSKSTGELLGGFEPESEFTDIPTHAALPIPEAGISIAELQSNAIPLEWYEAVAMTQALCETLAKWGDHAARVRIAADSVFINAAGEVNVAAGKRPGGPLPVKTVEQVAELLRSLLADKAIPTPLRLALTQASVSNSLEEWSKSVAYYERPNRTDLIKGVYERAVNRAASVAPHARPMVLPVVAEETPAVAPPPATVSRRKPWRFPKVDSRYVSAASAILGIAALIIVFVWVVLPMANSSVQRANGGGSPSVAGEDAAGVSAPSTATPTGSIKLQAALPPRNQRSRTAPGSTVEPRAADIGAPGSIGLIPPASNPLAPPLAAAPGIPGLSRAPDSADLSVIYSQDDADVVPPTAIYPQFPKSMPPGVGPDDVAEFYVIVSENGSVESVYARRVPVTMAEAMRVTMSLSAAKAWRFKPGTKDGHPVRYRTLVWVQKN